MESINRFVYSLSRTLSDQTNVNQKKKEDKTNVYV